MRSALSRLAPRLRATVPPNGSIFSWSSSARLNRSVRPWRAVIRWSTRAKVCVDLTE